MTVGQRDVEKRWGSPSAYRAPLIYVAVVVVIALVLLVLSGILDGMFALALAVPIAFLVGGLGALALGVRTYLRHRSWVGWQGAAWFLLALMLVTLPIAAAAR